MGNEAKSVSIGYERRVDATLARRSFLDFISLIKPDYIFNWHHLIIIDALQRLAERRYSRLILMVPPRHGKSELVSRLFPAWCYIRNERDNGRNGADEQVIVASYALGLASSMNRDCQKVITSDKYRELFPETHLSEGRDVGAIRTTERFDIVGARGYYLAAGVGGGITGAGATIAIIDDPVKNSQEADSKTYRDKTWDWYTSTFCTRFEPGCVEVVCQTRWHEDDLTGRILLDIKPGTEIISFPALCEHEEDNRGVGDALWASKYSRESLLTTKTTIGTRAWLALFQQKPSDEEGGLLKKAWFQTYDPRKLDLKNKIVNFYIDTAYTDKEKNDPTGGLAYVKDGANYYLLNFKTKYLEFNEQVKFVKDFAAENGYTHQSVIRIEPKATGKSIVQVMKAGTQLNIKEAISPTDSKTARVNSISAVPESGRVLIPEGMKWVDDFLTECAAFPNAAHDEAVDCLTGMIINEIQPKRGIRFAG